MRLNSLPHGTFNNTLPLLAQIIENPLRYFEIKSQRFQDPSMLAYCQPNNLGKVTEATIYKIFKKTYKKPTLLPTICSSSIAQLLGAVEYTDCHPTEGLDCHHPTQQVSWIWYQTIWWWGSSNAGALRIVEYSFIAIVPRSTLAWNGSTW